MPHDPDPVPSTHEVWREAYVKDAYADQTGRRHWGHVVHARIVLTETRRFPVTEPYSGETYEDAGIVAEDEHGREFRYTPNLTDYHGGGMWKCEADGTHWKRPP
jgi:hypothetical protein